jgi:hypothetical protein
MNLEDKLKELTQSQDVITKLKKKDIQTMLETIPSFEYSDQIFFIDSLVTYLEEKTLLHKNCDMFFKDPYIQKLLRDIVE